MLMTCYQETKISTCCHVQNEEYVQNSLLPWNQDHLHTSWNLSLNANTSWTCSYSTWQIVCRSQLSLIMTLTKAIKVHWSTWLYNIVELDGFATITNSIIHIVCEHKHGGAHVCTKEGLLIIYFYHKNVYTCHMSRECVKDISYSISTHTHNHM